MHRFYCPHIESATLGPEETHHALHVLRLTEGETVSVFNGRGKECNARLGKPAKDHIPFKVVQSAQAPEPAHRLTLGQAIPKGKAMELILQKTTELGISRIWPILSDRSVVQLDGEKSGAKQEKWQQLAIEACKQCGQNWMPEVKPALSLSELLSQAPPARLKIIASLQPEARPLGEVLAEARTAGTLSDVIFLVGPEGDFTPAEIGKARSAGYLPVSLGPTILRSETAAIFMTSVILYEMQRK